jgi:hypothetical protein
LLRSRVGSLGLQVVATCSLVLLAMPWSGSRPAFAAPTGVIFGVQAGVGVLAMDADGANRRVVVADPLATVVSAAPDGAALAYADSAGSGVSLVTAAGAAIGRIPLAKAIGGLAWSPDSVNLAVTTCSGGAGVCSLVLASSGGTGTTTLIPATSDGSGVAAPISWGDDGLVADLIGSAGGSICEPCRGSPFAIQLDGTVDGAVLPLAAVAGGGLAAQARTQPVVAYATASSVKSAAVQVFRSSMSLQPFATYQGFVSTAWSPDGSALALSNGHQVLEVQPGAGAAPQPIASFATYGVTSLSWVDTGVGDPIGCSVAIVAGAAQGIAGDPAGRGYWITDAYGSVSACGSALDYGGAGSVKLNKPVVSISALPDGRGYRLGAYDGGVLNFGDATAEHGAGTAAVSLVGASPPSPAWSIANTASGTGYWLATTDGHVYTFGDAGFYGPIKSLHLVAPLVAMVTTADGRGYWLAAADGGVFAFGDADFAGSLAGRRLPASIVGMATAAGGGYWLVGSDGSVYAFGGAPLLGSTSPHPPAPIRGMAATIDGKGYWLVDANGNVYVFGDALYEGSAAQSH